MNENAKPILGWYNRAIDATIIVSTEDAAYPKENLYDLRPDTFHKGTGSSEQQIIFTFGSAVAVTCVGIVGHDLHTQGASVKLQYYDYYDGSWKDCLAAWAPADNKAQFKVFASQSSTHFRLVVAAGYSAPPAIAVVFIGTYLTFPGWPVGNWDPDHQDATRDESISSLGHFLGTGVRFVQRKFSLSFSRILDSFVTSDLKPFWAWSQGKPFFVVPEITNHPSDVFYMVLDDPSFGAPWAAATRSHSISVKGLAE